MLLGFAENTVCGLFDSSVLREISVCSGVSQGSHIGPVVFAPLVNDRSMCVQYSQFLVFVDDVIIYISFKTGLLHSGLENMHFCILINDYVLESRKSSKIVENTSAYILSYL